MSFLFMPDLGIIFFITTYYIQTTRPPPTNMTFQTLFSPLNKDFCLYYYYLSIVGFLVLLISAIGLAYYLFLFASKSKDAGHFAYLFFGLVINSALMYFHMRLFYSMCVNSGMKAGVFVSDSAPAAKAPIQGFY